MSVFANTVLAGLLSFSPELALENSNILGYQKDYYTVDYNRLRADLSLENENHPDFFGKLILDNETLYTANPSSIGNNSSIYRVYFQYRGRDHFWSIGKQRIPLGVGRIWNPIDVFNPIDSEAVETDERTGTDSIRYEYAVSELSNIDVTLADGKGAMRGKGFFEFADVGLVGIWDKDNGRNIVGWELEGQLLETGIELRSEGGVFFDQTGGGEQLNFIIGAEYGFASSLTLLGEYNYSDATGNYLGMIVGYQAAMLWHFSLLVISNLDDHSSFIAPSIQYSLSDEMTLSAGAFFYSGSDDDAFNREHNRCYLRWFVHF